VGALRGVEGPLTCARSSTLLQGFSNVIVTRCMTARDWEILRRAQERQAEEILRNMRGHL
jgi:hypothetical protein